MGLIPMDPTHRLSCFLLFSTAPADKPMVQSTLALKNNHMALLANRLGRLWMLHFPQTGQTWNILARMASTATTGTMPLLTLEMALTMELSPRPASHPFPSEMSRSAAPPCGTHH